jgi:aminopeptidase N/puromycin-sensitive aminopeptidase
VLTDVSRTLSLGGACVPWVFANAGARGYYRTAYSSGLLRALAPHVETDLTAPERLALLDDEWALVRAGRHSIADYLILASGYGREHTSGVLEEVAHRLGFVHDYLTTDATVGRFETFTRRLLRPLFDEVGFAVAASDTDDRRSLRAAGIAALGTIGRDPDVVARARSAVDRSLSGRAPLDPTLADAVIKIAAAHGDAPLFDALAAAAERASDPEEHYRYLYALGDFREPPLIDRGLQLAVSPQLRSQDTAVYLSRFFANPDARSRAWAFLTAHWAALEPKITIAGGDTNLIRSISSFCDAASREQITSFFTAHQLPGAARTLQQTVEQINNCIGLRERQTPAVEAWLSHF